MLCLCELICFNICSVIIVITILSLYLFSIKPYNYWKYKNVKFVKPVPFFGNSMKTIFRKKTLCENQQEIYYSYPEEKYVGMFIFRIPVLMVRDPTLIHCIVTKNFGNFSDRGITTDERLDLLSLHLVNLKGQHWKSLRNKLAPAFSPAKLKSMCNNFQECSDSLSDNIDHCIQNNSLQEIGEIMAKYATDVIGSCAFGLQINSLKDPNSLFRKMGQEIFKPSVRIILKFITRAFHPSIPYYLNLKLLRPEVENFFLDFVKISMNKKENDPMSHRKDFIQILNDLRKDDSAIEETSESNCKFLNDIVEDSNKCVSLKNIK